jgi:hypothetical protein
MSSLWTPGGEHAVPREQAEPAAEDAGDQGELTEEQAEAAAALAAELDAARQRVAEVPAATIVANHAMGLFELGAIHLSSQPPHLEDASLAIDALGAVVDGLAGRLGEAEPTLRDALAQIRMAFVQVKQGASQG